MNLTVGNHNGREVQAFLSINSSYTDPFHALYIISTGGINGAYSYTEYNTTANGTGSYISSPDGFYMATDATITAYTFAQIELMVDGVRNFTNYTTTYIGFDYVATRGGSSVSGSLPSMGSMNTATAFATLINNQNLSGDIAVTITPRVNVTLTS